MTTEHDEQTDPLHEAYHALVEQARRAMAAQGETLRPELVAALATADLALGFRHFIEHGFQPEANIVQPLDLHPEVLRAVVTEQIRTVLGQRSPNLATELDAQPDVPVRTSWVIRRVTSDDYVKDISVFGPDDHRRSIHWTSQLSEALRFGDEPAAHEQGALVPESIGILKVFHVPNQDPRRDDVVWPA